MSRGTCWMRLCEMASPVDVLTLLNAAAALLLLGEYAHT